MTFQVLEQSLLNLSYWFDSFKRDLSFRQTPNAYKVWVSEIMLQQTTVTTVIPYYDRFINRYPTLKDLSSSSLEDVLKLWSGLGYYSRAKNLHRCAQIIEGQGGKFPKNRKELLKLPGIGDYTAGAILSFAYNLLEPLIDTNIARVISRLKGDPLFLSKKKRLRRISSLLVHKANSIGIPPSKFNTAIMELGSLVCKANKAECDECPLKLSCKTYQYYLDPLKIPSPKLKKPKEILEEKSFAYMTYCQGKKHLLITKDPYKKWLRDLWDLPSQEFIKTSDCFPQGQWTINYTITNHLIKRTIFLYCVKKNLLPELTHHYKWIPFIGINLEGSLAGTSILKKVIKKLINLEYPKLDDSFYSNIM